MSAKEKEFQQKSLKLYRGTKVAMLIIELIVITICDIWLVYVSCALELNQVLGVLINFGVLILTFLMGSVFKELSIRTEKES